ncbi:MAG: MerR family transcriptional regulator [Bacillota bacterium]|nr:MerR family transcriptional regulator [Bacillota bacterium]
MSDKKEYSIGEVSRRFNISLKTLRYYDELGLIKPSRRDENTGYRYYDETVAIRLCSIKYYQMTGLSLEEIRKFLFAPTIDELISQFESDLKRREKSINNAIMQKDAMQVWLDLLEEGKLLLQQDELPMGIRRVSQIETCYAYDGRSLLHARSTGQVPIGSIYVEYPSLTKRITGESQHIIRHMEVHPRNNRHIRTNILGGFTAASGIHIGPRENIAQTYQTMLAWSEKNGFKLQDCSYERYIIDESSINREEEFVTEILIPLKTETLIKSQ